MINIVLDEKSVFTYSAKELSVGIWDHRDGQFSGPVIGCIGNIKFANKSQLYHFMEMLQFILEKEN